MATLTTMRSDGVVLEGDPLTSTSPLAGLELTFVPGDPPRAGRFAAFRLDGELADDPLAGLGEAATIELVLPAGRTVRRRRLPATFLTVPTTLSLLLDIDGSPSTTATARCWSSVISAGIGLIARGRLRPAVTTGGFDAWRAGPLDPGDHDLMKQLADA